MQPTADVEATYDLENFKWRLARYVEIAIFVYLGSMVLLRLLRTTGGYLDEAAKDKNASRADSHKIRSA